LDLYIDEEDKYCVAVFNDEDLEFAIGRGGVNINLASRITSYRIDAYGKNEYERNQKQQSTLLSEIDGISNKDVSLLEDASVLTVSDVLDAEEETLTEIKGITSNKIEKIYNSIESFIELDNEEDVEEEVDVKELIEDLDEKLEVEVKEVAESEESEEGAESESV
jgi:N utilization substance protein A